MSIIDQAKRFFGLKKRKQRTEIEQLKKIIFELDAKAKGLKKRCRKEESKLKKEKMLKEYKAVRKLLKKGYRRLAKMTAEAEKA